MHVKYKFVTLTIQLLFNSRISSILCEKYGFESKTIQNVIQLT